MACAERRAPLLRSYFVRWRVNESVAHALTFVIQCARRAARVAGGARGGRRAARSLTAEAQAMACGHESHIEDFTAFYHCACGAARVAHAAWRALSHWEQKSWHVGKRNSD